MFANHKEKTSPKFLKKMRIESPRNCPRSLLGRKTEFWCTLFRLDDFLLNPLIQGHSGTTTETSQNVHDTNQGTIEDYSWNDFHPEQGTFQSLTTHNFGPEEGRDMVTGVHEEVTYSSPTTSSGKQKKNRSVIQPQSRSENSLATIEADQILLILQQLANNIHSANFYYKIIRISRMPK